MLWADRVLDDVMFTETAAPETANEMSSPAKQRHDSIEPNQWLAKSTDSFVGVSRDTTLGRTADGEERAEEDPQRWQLGIQVTCARMRAQTHVRARRHGVTRKARVPDTDRWPADELGPGALLKFPCSDAGPRWG